jgi:hypothetical protein
MLFIQQSNKIIFVDFVLLVFEALSGCLQIIIAFIVYRFGLRCFQNSIISAVTEEMPFSFKAGKVFDYCSVNEHCHPKTFNCRCSPEAYYIHCTRTPVTHITLQSVGRRNNL